MSPTTTTGVDSPDWLNNQGAGGGQILNFTQLVGNAVTFGTSYVGGWEHIYFSGFNAGAHTQAYQVQARFKTFATDLVGIATQTFEIEAGGTFTQVMLPVLAPFVEFVFFRLNGAGTELLQCQAIAVPAKAPAYAGVSGQLLINTTLGVLPAGGTLTITPNMVTGGVATLCVFANTNTWYAILQNLNAAGAVSSAIAYVEPVRFRGAMVTFALPPVRCRLTCVNTVAVADNISATLSVSYQS